MITPKLFVKYISPSPKMRSVIDYVWPLRVWERIWCGFSQTDSTKVTWLLLRPLSTFWAERNQVSLWRDSPMCLTFLDFLVLICEHKGLCHLHHCFIFVVVQIKPRQACAGHHPLHHWATFLPHGFVYSFEVVDGFIRFIWEMKD